jgi:rubrerythrin
LHIVDDLADEVPASDMAIQDMLIFAAKKESRAIALYDDLARAASAAGHDQVFRFLAGQEREHKLRLEAEYEKQFLQEN